MSSEARKFALGLKLTGNITKKNQYGKKRTDANDLCNTCSFLAVILSFTLIDRCVAPAIVAVSQQWESYGRMHENNR